MSKKPKDRPFAIRFLETLPNDAAQAVNGGAHHKHKSHGGGGGGGGGLLTGILTGSAPNNDFAQ
jgi:hypothetical protein